MPTLLAILALSVHQWGRTSFRPVFLLAKTSELHGELPGRPDPQAIRGRERVAEFGQDKPRRPHLTCLFQAAYLSQNAYWLTLYRYI